MDARVTSFQFKVEANGVEIVSIVVPRPDYPMSSDAAEAAMPPARLDIETAHMFWDSKPTPRKSGTPKYWMLMFDQPEVVTQVTLDVDQHCEHYIVCPGGRDANKQEISFIYSFDLAAEKWTALTFPEMNDPMFNMDAKVVELSDGTHQLVILSGQIAKGFSNVIQGYNFEGDVIQEVRSLGEGAINFAGRPALTGDPMVRWVNTLVQYPDGENDFSRSLIVVGGSEQSCHLETASTSVLDSVLFSVHGSTLKVGNPYRIQTQNMSMSNVGYTGLPYGAFDYKTYTSQAGSVGTKLSNMAKYSRHQNLPVRGILRRRPAGNTSAPSSNNTIVDFLLLGGFNSVGNEEHNKSVVSGAFIAMTWSASGGRTQMLYPLAINPLTLDWDSMCDRLLYFPDVLRNGEPYILGDCCAEYVEERDEVLCFGGRARATDTANAHAKSWKQVYEKYRAVAEQFQIKAAKLPRDYNAVVACLKAGYAVPYGTNKKLVLDAKTGWYRLSGSTFHCMCWSGYGNGFTYNKNSWCDGRGKLRLEDVKAQVNSNYFDCFVVLDIERTRESKPNYGL